MSAAGRRTAWRPRSAASAATGLLVRLLATASACAGRWWGRFGLLGAGPGSGRAGPPAAAARPTTSAASPPTALLGAVMGPPAPSSTWPGGWPGWPDVVAVLAGALMVALGLGAAGVTVG